MKLVSLVAISIALAATTTADARPRPHSLTSGAKRFEANKTFGLGIELGEPTSINGKWFVGRDQALDFGIGTIYHYRDRSGLNLYADYLWHPLVLTSAEAFELPLYVGIGGRYWDFDYGCDRNGNNCVFNASGIGVRVPVGISFDFNNVPLDIFIQLVPTLDFYRDYSEHDVYLDVNFSLGIRYWFS